MIADIFSIGKVVADQLISANNFRLSKNAILRALYAELTVNISLLELIDNEQLKQAEVDSPLFKSLVAQLETGVIYAILYSPEDINRSLYELLDKPVTVTDDTNDKPLQKSVLSAMIFISGRVALLQKLASLQPQFLNKKMRLLVRITNVLKDMNSVRSSLRELDGVAHFLVPSAV